MLQKVLGYERNVSCVPMGYSEEEQALSRNIPLKIKRLIPENKFIVGYFGGLGISNGLDTFFKTICEINNKRDIHFLIAGNGDLRGQYIKITQELKNITTTSALNKKYIKSLISHCDLLYFSTPNSIIWEYGQSMNKLIDYMLSGKPIIGSLDGYQTMINESGCGEFIKPDDSFEIAMKIFKYQSMKKSERKKIGLRGKNWILKK